MPHGIDVIAAGIDWLTLTSISAATKRRMTEYFMGISAGDALLGYKTTAGGQFGFYGDRCRHALFAHKDDRSLLQVSGSRARNALRMCRSGDNCTRLDIQITIKVPGEDVAGYLAYQDQLCRLAPATRGRRPEVKTVHGTKSIQTVYIGSRQSDVFIRLYDKFEESGDETYRGCVRMEVELKNKVSKALWAHCAKAGEGTMYLLQCLLGFLERRGVDVDGIDLQRQAIAPAKQEPLKKYVSLAWLNTQVSPTVARLVGELGMYTVFRALFDKALTERDFTTIMNAWSVSYS